MFCLILVAATLFLRDIRCNPTIEQTIKDYYASLNVFKKTWSVHRAPMEHAIKTAIAETAGLPGMNVYVRKHPAKLAIGYFHDDNNVKVIFSDLYLKGMPRCRLPDVQFPLSSNVIKIETQLSKIIIRASYSVFRDKVWIIHDAPYQDNLRNSYSPFLYSQVEDEGKIAIRADGCVLNGFIIATLGASSVNLGYDYFNITNCVYTIEVYNPEQYSLPVIAKYNLDKENGSELGLTDLMLRPLLTEDLLPKIQGAIFSFINSSAIFGNKLAEYKEKQETIFKQTTDHFLNLIRRLNKRAFEKEQESINIKDLNLKLNDENDLSLRNIKLFGLDTMYLAHSGGPVMMDDVMMVEEIRFSSLQAHGTLYTISASKEQEETFEFSAQIDDLAVDIHMDESHRDEGFKLLAVKAISHMVVVVSSPTNGTEESLIAGHLYNEVPKVIHERLIYILHNSNE